MQGMRTLRTVLDPQSRKLGLHQLGAALDSSTENSSVPCPLEAEKKETLKLAFYLQTFAEMELNEKIRLKIFKQIFTNFTV